MTNRIDIDSAMLRCNLFLSTKNKPKLISRTQIEQKFCVNLIRSESGAGTPDDPVQYGPPVCMFGAFQRANDTRMDYVTALAFNGRTEIGANPSLLAISGREFTSYINLCVDYQSIMKFLIDKNLLHMVDFAEVQEKIALRLIHGEGAVERFNEINAKSARIVASFRRKPQ